MKISILKSFLCLFVISLFSLGCDSSDVEDDEIIETSSIELDSMKTTGWIYSEVEFTGSGFGDDCTGTTVVFTSGTSQEITVQSCSDNSIIAWIPDTMEPDTYEVTLNVGGNSITTLNDNNLEVEVKKRPIIFTIEPSEIAPGETINITGKFLLNETTNPENNPIAWIRTTGFTNTMNVITVNAEGTAATVVISAMITPGPGVYDFTVTCEERSNEVPLTIL